MAVAFNPGDEDHCDENTLANAHTGVADASIEWGYAKGDLIVFKANREFQGQPRPFVYIGKVTGDEIAFGRRPEDLTLGQLREITAKRVK